MYGERQGAKGGDAVNVLARARMRVLDGETRRDTTRPTSRIHDTIRYDAGPIDCAAVWTTDAGAIRQRSASKLALIGHCVHT